MSNNEFAPECLSHRDVRHLQLRLDYMLLYQNENKAKIIRTLETWTNTLYADWYKAVADHKDQKREPPVENLWITMSYDQFSLFVFGTIQHDTIKRQVDELVAIGHVSRRPHPEFPYGPPQYLLNRKVVQKALDELEIPPNLFDLLPFFLSPRKNRTPPEKYPGGGGKDTPGEGGKIPPPSGEKSPPSNNSNKNQFKNKGTLADENFSSQESAPDFSDQGETEQQLPIANDGTTHGAALTNITPFPSLPTTPIPAALQSASSSRRLSTQKAQTRIYTPHQIRLIPEASAADDGSQNGYRKTDEAQPPAPEGEGQGSRKPREPKPKVSPKEVEEYLTLFDRLGKETGAFKNGYGHTGVDHDHVRMLLKNNLRPETPKFVTPAKLERVYRYMVEIPEDDGGYSWKEQGMSIKSVCNNYANMAAQLTLAAQKKRKQKQSMTAEEAQHKAAEDVKNGQRIGEYQYKPSPEIGTINYAGPRRATSQQAQVGG